MNKIYTKPTVEVIVLNAEDIMTTSPQFPEIEGAVSYGSQSFKIFELISGN